MSGRDVAVLIVSHDDADELGGCFEALAVLEPAPLELVVVDCASRDGSAARARELAPALAARGTAVTVHPLEENLGFAGGMNRALELSSAPFVLSLNADARPAPDYAARLVEAIESSGPGGLRFGAATGRLLRPADGAGGRRLDACGMRLTLTWRHLDRGSGEPDRCQLDRRERVFGATGAASLFRRRALDDAALEGAVFAAEMHSFREDAELCFRLQERGWEVVYEPRARAEHRRAVLPERRRRLPPEVNRRSLQNRYLLRAYHQTPRNLLLTLLPTLARDLLALAYVLAAERSSLPAYAWLWRHRRRIAARRRQIQARRTVPAATLDRWFLRRALPL